MTSGAVLHHEFEPHERHVYKIPAEEKPWWWFPPLDDPNRLIIERLRNITIF